VTASIAVVGGGLAGIAAALTAADGGAEVVLAERRTSLGGLTSSIVRNGLSFDNGQHVFLRCCTAYMAFLQRVGASEAVYLQRRLDVPVLAPDGTASRISRTSLPAPLHLLASLARYRHLSVGDRARLVRAALALRRLDPEQASLDATSFGSWLRAHGQSDEAIDRLWNIIALPTLNLPADEASLALATKVFRLGLLDRANGGDIGWSAIPLAELHGANAARALEAVGVECVLGAPVVSIERNIDGRFEIVMADHRREVDAVIVTTPPRTTAGLVASLVAAPESTSSAPAEVGGIFAAAQAELLGASPIVNVHLVLDRRVTEFPIAACVGSPIQFVFDRTAQSGARAGQCLGISLSAADGYIARRSRDLVSMFWTALGDVFPLARRARLTDAVVTRERAATFRAAPGSRALRPTEETAVTGLFLAGAWCDTGWPATMEGAVRSGTRAASGALSLTAGGTQRAPSRATRTVSQPARVAVDVSEGGQVHLEEATT
jgi:squalene-associated FAD-dependent desaturase